MRGVVRDSEQVPERRIGNDSAAVRDVIDARDDCELFTLRTVRAVSGHSIARETGDCEELLFVVSGRGSIVTAAGEHEVEPQAGLLLGPGDHYEFVNPGSEDIFAVSVALHGSATPRSVPELSRLADATAQSATADREFRIVFDADSGCPAATQFVGYIPVGAAPPHYHLYNEVIYVLDGHGVMHMGGEQTPLRAGSAISLPAREVHTLANSGPGVMRVLGVFRPSGSPAAAYYPDGTAAQVAAEPQTAEVTT
ncbi:MAG TPA: cupin domain-containing protein [Solirubrobacteraceae bacterium]|jgi:mannose-6-phosphate isomerase-like protein (cupin superfamily)